MATKGIWVPIEILQDKSLTMHEKFVLMEISQLCDLEENKCYALNEHFAKMLNVSKKSISNTMSSLVKKGLIEIELSDRNHKRLLSIKDGHPSTKDGHPSTKDGQSKENKTINKTINKENKEKEFNFTLTKKTTYEKLSRGYKDKLKAKCLLADGNLERYDAFVIQLEAKGYSFKNFFKAYLSWDKDMAYKDYSPIPEPQLGDNWYKVHTKSGIIAINDKTLEMRWAKVG